MLTSIYSMSYLHLSLYFIILEKARILQRINNNDVCVVFIDVLYHELFLFTSSPSTLASYYKVSTINCSKEMTFVCHLSLLKYYSIVKILQFE